MYRRTYHNHVTYELVRRTLREKCLATDTKKQVGNMEDLHQDWEMLEIGFNRPKKYIINILNPIIKFRKFTTFDHAAIC